MQDLCVRITSPESLVQLVQQIQQEENDAKKQVREMKIHQAVQQAEKVGEALPLPDTCVKHLHVHTFRGVSQAVFAKLSALHPTVSSTPLSLMLSTCRDTCSVSVNAGSHNSMVLSPVSKKITYVISTCISMACIPMQDIVFDCLCPLQFADCGWLAHQHAPITYGQS